MRSFIIAVLALFSLTGLARAEWAIDRMDAQIEDTNIILGMDANPFCSGTIISRKDRLILTAAHCVADAFNTKTITETDPKTGEVREKKIETSEYLDTWQDRYLDYDVVSSIHYAAKVVTRDAKTDVAILQVLDPEWIPKQAAPMSKSAKALKRGQTVYVVGNPAGVLDASVTKGIVSNTQRKLPIGADKTSYFQVDAAIIGGNSGGAVYDDDGQLIGVVSAGIMLVKAGFKEFAE